MPSKVKDVKQKIKKYNVVKQVAEEKNKSWFRKIKSFYNKHTNIINYSLIIIGALLIIYPFLPEAEYLYNKKFNPEKFEEIDISDEAQAAEESSFIESNYDIKDRVIISSIGIDEPITFGSSEDALKYGTWMKDKSAAVGEVGNKILTGHRFSYLGGGGPFYHLKKVNIGDSVLLYVKGTYYKYEVSEKFTVNEDEVWIEDPRNEDILTMYTCEGLEAKQRMVVVAKRVEI